VITAYFFEPPCIQYIMSHDNADIQRVFTTGGEPASSVTSFMPLGGLKFSIDHNQISLHLNHFRNLNQLYTTTTT